MRITFLSNYINHHQIPLCNALAAEDDVDFCFVQTQKVEEERLKMGWQDASSAPEYVLFMDGNREEVKRRVLTDDVVLAGWAPPAEDLVLERLEKGLLTFRVSERIYKDGQWKMISPRGLLDKYKTYTRFRNKPYYLLCAGAYVASDFALIGAFPGKKFRWGYFPPVKEYEAGELEEKKGQAEGPVQMIWAGRFVDFKHIEIALRLAKSLRDEGFDYHLHVAGGGDAMPECEEFVRNNALDNYVTFHGFCPPQRVRELMERCRIFVFTSDHGEGWGAVVNEAMNSGCAVVAGSEAGCVPFLIKHEQTGLIYNREDEKDLLEKTKLLLTDRELAARLAEQGRKEIVSLWNGPAAAQRLLLVCTELLSGASASVITGREGYPQDGPMSVDHCLKPFLKVPSQYFGAKQH